MPAPERDQPTLPLTLAEARLRLRLEPNMTLSQDPDGKIVIQELDSPVTRREKAMRKKQARSRLSATVIKANSDLDGSDLSSLSELSEDEDGRAHIKKTLNETKTSAVQPGEVILQDGKMLDGGTLGELASHVDQTLISERVAVWAKASMFYPDNNIRLLHVSLNSQRTFRGGLLSFSSLTTRRYPQRCSSRARRSQSRQRDIILYASMIHPSHGTLAVGSRRMTFTM